MTNILSRSPIPGLEAKLAPSAPVGKGLWVDDNGDQVTVAGVRAKGIAFQSFSAAEVAAVNAYPPARLTVIVFGPARAILGATVASKSFVTCNAAGETIAATTANHEVLGWLEEGGDDGDEREVFILRNDILRKPSAAIADLVAATGTADGTVADVGGAFNQGTLNDNFKELSVKVNAILTALRLQKMLTP
jgi:hypothetical protein